MVVGVTDEGDEAEETFVWGVCWVRVPLCEGWR